MVNFDKLTYCGNLENLRDVAGDRRYSFVKGDIADERVVERVFKKYHPGAVINFAAETHVDRSIHGNAGDFVRTNIEGVRILLEAVRRYPEAQRYVQVSTDEVYGDLPLGSGEKFREHSSLRPSSPYAATKAAGDLLCLAYHRTFGIPAVITRSGNNFGPRQYPEKLIPFFVTRLMEGKKIPLYGDGEHVRDWIHVEDHCHALDVILRKGKAGEIYHIGAETEKSNRAVAEELLRAFGRDAADIEFVADRPGHDRRYALATEKIRETFGWRPRREFGKAIVETLRWYRDNHLWLKRVMKKTALLNPHLL